MIGSSAASRVAATTLARHALRIQRRSDFIKSDLGGNEARWEARPPGNYSHSIVAGGLELMSKTTRPTPRTSFVIRLETLRSSSCGNFAQSAVIASVLSTT